MPRIAAAVVKAKVKKVTPTRARGRLTKYTQPQVGSLGCSRKTVYEYLKRYSSLNDVLTDAREDAIDHVESKLMTAEQYLSTDEIASSVSSVLRYCSALIRSYSESTSSANGKKHGF